MSPAISRQSYLFKKINAGLDSGFTLDTNEGATMPFYNTPLSDTEQEIIRQWIVMGAPLTGEVIDEQMIEDYYAGEGLPKIEPLAPPAEGEGFQIYVEPFFVAPGDEVEYFHKHKLDFHLPENLDVTKLDMHMDDFSHHYIMYKYLNPSTANNVENGRRVLNNILDIADSFINTTFVSVWQYDLAHELPQGTAYKWDTDDVLDLNYHIKNYSQTQILAAEAYINIYTQARDEENIEMHSNLEAYSMFDPFALVIYPGENTYSMEQYNSNSDDTLYIWTMQAHTHKFGTDYDIYLRNEDGSLGEQIYEGFYNADYTQNVGFYDYEHPAVLKVDELLPVPLNTGLTHVAQFFNNTSSTVGFGLTTNDEMFITYYQYTTEPLPHQPNDTTNTSISLLPDINNEIAVYPNPANNILNVNVDNKTVNMVTIYDINGKQVMQSKAPNFSVQHLPSGVYSVVANCDNIIYRNKFAKIE